MSLGSSSLLYSNMPRYSLGMADAEFCLAVWEIRQVIIIVKFKYILHVLKALQHYLSVIFQGSLFDSGVSLSVCLSGPAALQSPGIKVEVITIRHVDIHTLRLEASAIHRHTNTPCSQQLTVKSPLSVSSSLHSPSAAASSSDHSLLQGPLSSPEAPPLLLPAL